VVVLGLAGHGLKDLWQHRRQFVATTRWWPPFCLVIDWVAAAIIAVESLRGCRHINRGRARAECSDRSWRSGAGTKRGHEGLAWPRLEEARRTPA
jgi:hypothetical protein